MSLRIEVKVPGMGGHGCTKETERVSRLSQLIKHHTRKRFQSLRQAMDAISIFRRKITEMEEQEGELLGSPGPLSCPETDPQASCSEEVSPRNDRIAGGLDGGGELQHI